MPTMIVATRGGKASALTQKAAIERAKEESYDIIFFYVFDLAFLSQANYAQRYDIVEQEMTEMVDFLLAMAVDRAEEAGVEAEPVRRQGIFADELVDFAEESHATLVVLGRPEIEGVPTEQRRFEMQILEDLAERLRTETTDTDVWIVPASVYDELRE